MHNSILKSSNENKTQIERHYLHAHRLTSDVDASKLLTLHDLKTLVETFDDVIKSCLESVYKTRKENTVDWHRAIV